MNKLVPALFIGHGSPMNLIQENEFTKDLKSIGKLLEKPKAIVVISAHWLSDGTFVTEEEEPKMIYDFYGFPKELYKFKYQANGSPEIAEMIKNTIIKTKIQGTKNWGHDHASYMILQHLFPDRLVKSPRRRPEQENTEPPGDSA